MLPPYVSYAATESPLGPFWVAVGERGVVRAGPNPDGGSFARLLALDGFMPSYAPNDVSSVLSQFDEYFAGERRTFDLEIDLDRLSSFRQSVLHAVRDVPFGEVRSYRNIAEAVGKPLAARAVGGAVAENPISIVIPCHRIVKSDGSVGYYATGVEPDRGVPRKLFLLGLEGRYPGKGLA
jgi:methylated-DNA-[protein]-cysteine S-methyltransferase